MSNLPWKRWYKTARWAKLRQQVFMRDLYTCQRSGLICSGEHPAPDSPVANHKVAHRGNPDLFWDIDNIETVSKEVHDGLIQAEEQATLHQRGVWY
jgi:5-methylcytosine-specific restriction endonuclease McrA